MKYCFLKYPLLLASLMTFSFAVAQTAPFRPIILDFSYQGGFYDQPIELELICPGATIYYSLDGNLPDAETNVYSKPIRIDSTTVVRAIAHLADGRKSSTHSHTYFINEPETSFPVISISISPKVLFDPEKGLYMAGQHIQDSLLRMPGANFWSRDEVQANCEIFESDKRCVHRSPSGFRLFGGISRTFPQKSMTIVARKEYGEKRIDYPILGPNAPSSFKFLVLRNSGSDFGKTHFRDAFMTSLLDGWDIETQAYRPAQVYINGAYWGIYNMREKVNRYFLNSHFPIDKDSIDLIEHRMSLKRGSVIHYRGLLDFLQRNSLESDENYRIVQSMMDVDNFMNYQIAQIYFDNRDAGGNIKFWRPQTPEGIWRWILYDTDWGFGLHYSNAYAFNTLAFHTKPDGPAWPNPPWSTFLLRSLLANKEFKTTFIQRFADHLNTTFRPKRVLAHIDYFEDLLEPEIDRHLERWRLSKSVWRKHIERMRTFAKVRPFYMRRFLSEMFHTGPTGDIEITARGGGKVWINGHEQLQDQTIRGEYFQHLPLKLEAEPLLGYRFVHWDIDGSELSDRFLEIYPDEKAQKLVAVFESFRHPLEGKVLFNEINPNGKFSGDWVEIYNNSDQVVQMKDWIMVDLKRHRFEFPDFPLNPKSYLIVCKDTLSFQNHYPDQYNYLGNLNFGVNKRREMLRLFSNDGAAIDSFYYHIPAMDSIFSVALLLPSLDNTDFENWEIYPGSGTPNSANPYFFKSKIQPQQALWMRIGAAIGFFLVSIFFIWLYRQKT